MASYKLIARKNPLNLGTATTLWMADDHLLYVRSQLITETYRRVYLADLQSIAIRKTHLGKVQNAVLSALFAAFGLGVLAGLGIPQVLFFAIAGCCLFLVALGFNVSLGPTAELVIRTRSLEHTVSCPGRLNSAAKLMEKISEAARALQPDIPKEELIEAIREAEQPKAKPDSTPALEAEPGLEVSETEPPTVDTADH